MAGAIMVEIACKLPHLLYVVLPYDVLVEAAPKYITRAPANKDEIQRALEHLNTGGGVPAYLEKWSGGDDKIIFCTRRFEIGCGLSKRGDAYRVGHLSPLSLKSHGQLARQRIQVTCAGWRLLEDVRELTEGQNRSGFGQILSAWKQVQEWTVTVAETQPSSEAPEVMEFHTQISTLIDASRQAELDTALAKPYIPVTGVTSVPQTGLSGSIYYFTLRGPHEFQPGAYVRVWIGAPGEGSPGYSGTVASVDRSGVKVNFRQPVDFHQLEHVEWMSWWASGKQYKIQDQALDALVQRNARNRYLLDIIVHHQFKPYYMPELPLNTDSSTKRALNDAQRVVVARAKQNEDLLLVLGPPGTGKTHTIREMVAQQVAQNKRVLITSKNNKAVDNVLEDLDPEQVIRIGREEAISEKILPLMIDAKACQMQADILAHTEVMMEMLDVLHAQWPDVQRQLDYLQNKLLYLRLYSHRLAESQRDLTEWQTARYADYADGLKPHLKRMEVLTAHIRGVVSRAEQLSNQIDRLASYSRWPLVGPICLLWASRVYRDWQQLNQQYHKDRSELGLATEKARRIWRHYQQYASSSMQALRYKKEVEQAERELNTTQADLKSALGRIELTLKPFDNVPLMRGILEAPGILERYCQDLRDWHESMKARTTLLSDWRDLLKLRHQALYPSLIRDAKVIGATCIGIATDAQFEDLEFDLVIADEAGQIQVMDLLVPLVRAKRAVLVGDHRQLPPVLDPGVAERVNTGDEPPPIWLEKSLFEILYDEAPDTHKVMLDTQYRMPATIANFISAYFYEGHYKTAQPKATAKTTPVYAGFKSPLVFIDTREEKQRQEKIVRDVDGSKSYQNHLEARLLANLIDRCQGELIEQSETLQIGVIVPYKKQAEYIRKLLRNEGHYSEKQMEELVSTVDAFQGKQRRVILYGFTRSNPWGNIGFLHELRRLNVSMTRAQDQLIMVGDSTTLRNAADKDFRSLICALLKTIESLPNAYYSMQEALRVIHE